MLHSYKNGFSVTTIKLCEEDEKEEEEQEEKEEEGTMMNMEKVTSAS